MILIDEIHVVTVAIEGVNTTVARANLCGDVDTVNSFRSRAYNAYRMIDGRAGLDAFMTAFDEAFEGCERKPGGGASSSASFGFGEVIIARTVDF